MWCIGKVSVGHYNIKNKAMIRRTYEENEKAYA